MVVLVALIAGSIGWGIWLLYWWLSYQSPHEIVLRWNLWHEWLPEGIILHILMATTIYAMYRYVHRK